MRAWDLAARASVGTMVFVIAASMIGAGDSHACGVRSDDRVVCWGWSGTDGAAPPGPSTEAFESVSAGYAFTCGVRADHRVVCWGIRLAKGLATPWQPWAAPWPVVFWATKSRKN